MRACSASNVVGCKVRLRGCMGACVRSYLGVPRSNCVGDPCRGRAGAHCFTALTIRRPFPQANRLELTIDGMGCEACELHVRGVLEAAAGVINTAVSFEAGTAALIVGNGLRFNLTGIIEQLATDGYIASLA